MTKHGSPQALDRRAFLKLGSSFASGLAFGCSAEAEPLPVDPVSVDALVVGSGFGGAVAALRLGEAGLQTVVLERGRRWDIGPDYDTFSSIAGIDGRAAWLAERIRLPGIGTVRVERHVGVLEPIVGENVTVLVGAGVGGGSLVYGAVLAQPTREAFYRSLPTEIDYAELAERYYPRARQMLGASPIPDAILARSEYALSRLALKQAEASGLGFERVSCGVDWGVVEKELSGELPPSMIRGDYLFFGTNSGAKNSVDRNYLPAAERTGRVAIHPQHWVQHIEPFAGGYRVLADRIDSEGNVLDTREYRAAYLFLAAGAMGSVRLLLKAKAVGALPNLSDDLGGFWATNGDETIIRVMGEEVGAAQGGPPVVMVTSDSHAEGPAALQYFPSHLPFECGCATALRMRVGEQFGTLRYDESNDAVIPDWPAAANQTPSAASLALEAQLDAGAPGTASASLPELTNFSHTYHPLGGATFGRVCDMSGRVLGHQNLYIVDGALIAGYTGARNPALTITALAERNIERILREDIRGS